MTRQRDHSAIIRGLTHADTYIGEGSERDAGITLGPPFSARNPPLRQLRDQCIWLTASGIASRYIHTARRRPPNRQPASGSGDGDLPLLNAFNCAILALKSLKSGETMPNASVIPVIDLGPYRAGEPGALDRAAAELRHALTEIGFYSIVNHGVPSALVHEVYRQVARFHAQPLDEKLKIKLDKHNVGYLQMMGDTLRTSVVANVIKPNMNEAFFMARDLAPDHPDVVSGRRFRSANQWPECLPGFRDQGARDAVIDDEVEADLGQRVAQLDRGAVERPGLSRERGPEIDDRDRVSIGHGFSWLASTVFDARIAPFNASSNGKSGVAATAGRLKQSRCRSHVGDVDISDRFRNRQRPLILGRGNYSSCP